MLKQYFYITSISLAILLVAFLLMPSKDKQNQFFEKEIEKVLELKGEKLIFVGKQLTKVRTERGLAKKPVTTPFRLYVNKETGTFTVLEYHSSYETFCVIAYGSEFEDFREVL